MLPLLAVSLISLFAFVALAVDLGMLAVSRTHCQNAADASALTACRTLNNQPGVPNNNLAQAVANAKTTITSNYWLSTQFTSAQIQKIEAGQYLYNTSTQTFSGTNWTDVTNNQTTLPPAGTGSWTAIRTTLSVTQPTYFMGVFGVTTMPSGSQATAVYRPRDVAFVLDMTGSMGYASQFNFNGISMNGDPLVPAFGHYVSVQGNLVAPTNQANGNGEAISRNNYTMTTPGGPPIVRTFFFDPTNVSTPATSAYPVSTTAGGTINLINAFHRWSPPETPGDPTNYVAQTYDFTGYNAFNNGTEATPKGPTPAPYSFQTMTDSTSPAITYVGDRYRRSDGSINKTDTTWATTGSYGASTTRGAATDLELLGYNLSGTNVNGGLTGTTTITTVDKFRDLVWEQNGYDLNIVKYRSDKGTGAPLSPSPASSTAAGFASQTVTGGTYVAPLQVTTDATYPGFQGYSMGPGYYGKTFYIWPPDPRWGGGSGTPNPTSLSTTNSVKDTNGNWLCDWRRRFFLTNGNAAWTAGSTTATASIDQSLLRTSGGGMMLAGNGNYNVNYAAVLKWIKTGPQVLPPNLRAGRVLYYSSIPDDVNTATGTAQQQLDKVFWQNYIDFVLGANFTSSGNLYGNADSWSSAPQSIYTAGNLNPWNGPNPLTTAWPNVTPYMAYGDSPLRPRLHMWFGPLTMMDFLHVTGNWLAGTCSEAQCWQLKVGMNSVINDVQNNHPNDYMGLVMFAAPDYNSIRRPMGQNYKSLQNALFYPSTLLNAIDGGDITSEFRPYDINFNDQNVATIPNANGSTDPNTGFAYGFNLLSPSAQLPANPYGTTKGRRGASKVIIFETDGVPNTWRGLSSSVTTMNPTLLGYDTYYPTSGWCSGNQGNGNSSALSEPIKVVQQIVKPMATTNGGGVNSGMSLPNAPAYVYPIAFGDLFDPVASPNATFRPTALQFLADVAAAGNTGPAGATTIPSGRIITGPYTTRIQNLKTCMQDIFQSGVAVSLIQ
jgi:hypothetical protein